MCPVPGKFVLTLGKFSRFAMAVAFLLAALLLLAVASLPSPAQIHLVSNLGQSLILIWAAVCSSVVARRSSGHLRHLWQLFAASLWIMAAGESMVTYLSSFARAPAATPWPSDILIFIWVVPAAMMLLPYEGGPNAGLDWMRMFDAIQAGIVALTAYLYFFYVPSRWEAEGLGMFRRMAEVIVSRDLLLSGAFAVRLFTLRSSPRRTLFGRMSAFFLAVGIFDFIGIGQLGQMGRAAEWAGAVWSLPYVFAALIAATWDTKTVDDLKPSRTPRSGWVASQVLPVCIPLLVILMGHRIASEQLTIAWFAIGSSFACSGARLVLTNERQHRIAMALRRTQEALRHSEHMFSTAFRASPDAISLSLVPEGSVQEVNDSFVRLTGFQREEVIGHSAEELGLWVDEEQMVSVRAKFREAGEIHDQELRFRRKDGEIRFGNFSGAIIALDDHRYGMVVVRDITESKRAEEALRSTELRFRSLVQTLRVGVSSWTPDGRCQFVNQALLEMSGLTEDRVMGKQSVEIMPAYYADGSEMPNDMRPAARALATGRPVRNQVVAWRAPASKDLIWTLVDAVPEFGPDGQVVGAIASMTNITDLKRAEEQTRISQEMFSKAFHSSPDAVTITTLDEGRYVEVNEGFTRLSGWSREEVIGKTVKDLGIWLDPAEQTKLRSKLLNEGRTSQFEATLLDKERVPRAAQISADLITLDGKICVLSLAHDITLRKRQEAELRASEQRSRTLLEALRVGVSTWGPDGRLQFVNKSLLEMFGTPGSEILGKSSPELLPAINEDGTTIPADMRPVARVLRSHVPVRNQLVGFRLSNPDRVVWTLADAVPEFSADGKLARVIASLTEVTNLKRAEEEKRASEAMFTKAFQASPDSMTISTFDEGRYIAVNEGFTRLFGWQRDEVIGKTVQDLAFWPSLEDHKKLKSDLLNAGRASRVEATLRVKSGELRTVQISADLISVNGQTCVLALAHDITERKRREAELRASEQRSRTLLEAIRVGVSTWGPDGRCRSANWTLQEMTGMTEDHFIGKTGSELGAAYGEDGKEVPPALRPAALARATRAPVRKQVLGLKVPMRDKLVWVLADAVPEYSPDGEFQGMIASYTDITDLKQAQEQTRSSQEMFSKAFHSSPDAVTITTMAEGRYVEINEGYTRLFGWSREEVIGKTVFELGIWPNPKDRESLKRALREHGQVRQLELELRTKGGNLRTILHSADVIELNGQACMLAVSDDITEWKQSQEALRFSEERFRTLVHSLDVGVVLLGTDGRIQFANPAALHMFQVRLEAVAGRTPAELGLVQVREDGSPVPEIERPAIRVLQTGQPVRNVVLGFLRPGIEELLWVYGNLVPLLGEDGRMAGVVASFADITEQRKASEAMRQLSGRLLQLQDEERRRLGRDLHDSLAQSVLAVNLNLAQVIHSSTLDDRSKRVLADTRNLLQEMSREIRTLSYLLHPPLLDELGLASAVKEYALGFSERSGIHIQVGVSPGFGRLPQDAETALFRIIQESLANIQRHSGSPSARIRLTGTPGGVTLEVSDQGKGITASSGKKLDKAGAKLGVGIAGMRERMSQLGGTLEIETGKSGTTIRATLPLKAEVLDAASRSRGG